MQRVQVGFELAEIDLKMRGPGETYGTRQSGYTDLKIADLSNRHLIELTQMEAKNLVEEDLTLKNYPLLIQKISQIQKENIAPN